MKYLIIILILLATTVDAKPKRPFWSHYKRTATGKHHYMKPGWPYERQCVGMYRRTPIKIKTVRRMTFWKPTKQ